MADGQPLLLHPTADKIDTSGRAKSITAHTFGDDRLAAVLLRPDGVIAWAAKPGDDLDPPTLRHALETWCPPRQASSAQPDRSLHAVDECRER
jgi:hypothetical protein